MPVLILKNISTEGPGTIEDFLGRKAISYRIVELKTEPIPDTDMFDTLIMLGGPMSVNESEIYPYISKEEELAMEFIAKGKKIFGLCLGAQIIAKALGANVYKGTAPEIGWHDIEITDSGLKDCMMNKLAIHPKAADFWKKFKVFHWHGETFDIPDRALRLAKSDLYQNQAFKYKDHAYAFQFHIEVTKDMVYDWLKDEPINHNTLKTDTERLFDIYKGRAENFYNAFFAKN